MQYALTTSLQRELLRIAAQTAPHEACGVVFGCHDGERVLFYVVVNTPNEAIDPVHEFVINPNVFHRAAQLAERMRLWVGVWHSHPTTRPHPSPQDKELLIILKVPFLIVGVHVPVITVYEYDEQIQAREAAKILVDEALRS